MRRAFTKSDFLNVREAKIGDSLEYGRTNVAANMGGECDPVYGFWEHNREVPVYVPDGVIVEFGQDKKRYRVTYEGHQMLLIPTDVIKLIDLSFDPKDWGVPLTVLKTNSRG